MTPLTGDQPPPTPNDLPAVQDLVREDLAERKQLGIARYGTPLQAGNGRDALVDAYQEALDLSCYLRQAIAERDLQAADPDRRAELAADAPLPVREVLLVDPAALEALDSAADSPTTRSRPSAQVGTENRADNTADTQPPGDGLDRAIEAFAALDDCPECEGTGKDLPPDWRTQPGGEHRG